MTATDDEKMDLDRPDEAHVWSISGKLKLQQVMEQQQFLFDGYIRGELLVDFDPNQVPSDIPNLCYQFFHIDLSGYKLTELTKYGLYPGKALYRCDTSDTGELEVDTLRSLMACYGRPYFLHFFFETLVDDKITCTLEGSMTQEARDVALQALISCSFNAAYQTGRLKPSDVRDELTKRGMSSVVIREDTEFAYKCHYDQLRWSAYTSTRFWCLFNHSDSLCTT